MTDRELLEWAAKVAGLVVLEWIESGADSDQTGGPDWGILHKHENGGWIVWNPLTDDGDALRLAVVLGMEVYIDNHPDGCACTEAQSHSRADNARAIYNHTPEEDQFAATRRAIVHAAAAIGKEMP